MLMLSVLHSANRHITAHNPRQWLASKAQSCLAIIIYIESVHLFKNQSLSLEIDSYQPQATPETPSLVDPAWNCQNEVPRRTK